MSLCCSYLAPHILSSCARSPAFLVSVSIASIDGHCCDNKDWSGLDRLDLGLVGYCVKGNSGKLNKGIINTMKGNANNMYTLCHIEGIMNFILWWQAAFLVHLQPKWPFWPFSSPSYEPIDPVIYQCNDHILIRGFMGHSSVKTMHLEWWQMVQHKDIYAKKCPT